ncbi:uncharacterized protein LOC144920802 [Branchiostoma floridae x Branchiostoma belcheri]
MDDAFSGRPDEISPRVSVACAARETPSWTKMAIILAFSDSMCKHVGSHVSFPPGFLFSVNAHPGASVYDLSRDILFYPFVEPDVVYVHVGTNNLHMHRPLSRTIDDFSSLISITKSRFPSASVVISSVLRRFDSLDGKRIELNDLLSNLCSHQGVIFLDNGSQARRAMFARDGLHLSLAGNVSFSKYLSFRLTNIVHQHQQRCQPPSLCDEEWPMLLEESGAAAEKKERMQGMWARVVREGVQVGKPVPRPKVSHEAAGVSSVKTRSKGSHEAAGVSSVKTRPKVSDEAAGISSVKTRPKGSHEAAGVSSVKTRPKGSHEAAGVSSVKTRPKGSHEAAGVSSVKTRPKGSHEAAGVSSVKTRPKGSHEAAGVSSVKTRPKGSHEAAGVSSVKTRPKGSDEAAGVSSVKTQSKGSDEAAGVSSVKTRPKGSDEAAGVSSVKTRSKGRDEAAGVSSVKTQPKGSHEAAGVISVKTRPKGSHEAAGVSSVKTRPKGSDEAAGVSSVKTRPKVRIDCKTGKEKEWKGMALSNRQWRKTSVKRLRKFNETKANGQVFKGIGCQGEEVDFVICPTGWTCSKVRKSRQSTTVATGLGNVNARCGHKKVSAKKKKKVRTPTKLEVRMLYSGSLNPSGWMEFKVVKEKGVDDVSQSEEDVCQTNPNPKPKPNANIKPNPNAIPNPDLSDRSHTNSSGGMEQEKVYLKEEGGSCSKEVETCNNRKESRTKICSEESETSQTRKEEEAEITAYLNFFLLPSLTLLFVYLIFYLLPSLSSLTLITTYLSFFLLPSLSRKEKAAEISSDESETAQTSKEDEAEIGSKEGETRKEEESVIGREGVTSQHFFKVEIVGLTMKKATHEYGSMQPQANAKIY